jgi:hypothetical protein
MTTAAVTPLTPVQLAAAEQHAVKEGYLFRLVKGLDEFGNVATDGNLGQSLSSRIGLDAAKGIPGAVLLAKMLDRIEKNHSVLAEAADEAQALKVVDTETASPDLPAQTVTVVVKPA